MTKEREGSKKVVLYEHPDGVIFIHPTTRRPNGRHKTNSNMKESVNELGGKIRAMLESCD